MTFGKKIAWLMIVVAIHLPCAGYAAEEDSELARIAAEQKGSDETEQLDDINPALTESLKTEQTRETDKEVRERKKKLQQTRKEKEAENARKLEESERRDARRSSDEPTITIDQNATPVTGQPVQQPTQPPVAPPKIDTVAMPDQKAIYANFSEVSRAVKFIPLYMPRKSGYEITALYAANGIAEVRYGRRWEPTVSLTVRTHKRAEGEPPQDISGVTGVKWRVDTSTGTTIYIAKISETQQVAAWAVGHYTFSAQAENLSYAGFHSLVADELVELSTHYYLDL